MVGDSPHSLFVNLSSLTRQLIWLTGRHAESTVCGSICFVIRPVEGRPDGSLLDGTKPFTKTIPGTSFYDLTTPNEAYFAHVDESHPNGGDERDRGDA